MRFPPRLPFHRRPTVLFGILFALWLAGCATQPHPDTYGSPGFFMGLFHGATMVFSLVASIFTDTRIYAFPNSGGWYDFGYVLGAFGAVGGAGAGSRAHAGDQD